MNLTGWQSEFLRRYPEARGQKTLLVAPAGAGKTHLGAHAARTLLERKLTDVVVLLTRTRALKGYWVDGALAAGINVASSVHAYQGTEGQGLCESTQELRHPGVRDYISRLAQVRRVFVLVDDVDNEFDNSCHQHVDVLVNEVLLSNPSNKVLFLARRVPVAATFDAEFRIDNDLRLTWSILDHTNEPVLVTRPFSVVDALRRLAEDISHVDEMPWRHFERVVAALLEAEGYDVKLMRGSKDGGIDIVAVKSDPVSGCVELVVQVKRRNPKYKVDITVVRQLAAVQTLCNATKGLIVTSTFLTRDALALVEQEKKRLAKVDRGDLSAWLQRVHNRRGPTAAG